MNHEEKVQKICSAALEILTKKYLHFRPMQRKNHSRPSRRSGFVIGRTNLKTGLITIDIYTPKFRKPRKVSSILRILCHEVAHHQKKPYRQRYKGRLIIRRHYPGFYKQVNNNINKLKKNISFSPFFN